MELNDLYDYGLKIYQNADYFKFSLDSILLGEFVELKANQKILDLCTGNAPIPLILSTKREDIQIDGLEIQKEIFTLAQESIKINNLDSRIELHNVDAKTFSARWKYDIVLANPPYFKVSSSSQKNENLVKQIARHEVTLNLADVIMAAKRNLKENGTFYMVHRVDRLLDSIHELEKAKFGLRKIVFIHTKSDEAEIFLIQASKYKKSDMKVRSIFTKDRLTYKNIFKEELK